MCWTIHSPRVDSTDDLIIDAGKPLDEPIFARAIRFEDANGVKVSGRAMVDLGGATLRFHPDQPWRIGGYRLRVDHDLEDLAGNRPRRLFDQPAASEGDFAEVHDVVRWFEIP